MEELVKFEKQIKLSLSEILNESLIKPTHAVFCIPGRCNLKCKMCHVWKYETKIEDELTSDEIKKIIDKIIEFGINYVSFSGGEPTVRNDLVELIQYAVNKNIFVDFNTNATLINKKLAKRIISTGITKIFISLESTDEKIDDYLRGVESFKKTLMAIKYLTNFRGKRKNPLIYLRTVVMRQNLNNLLDLIFFAKKNNLDGINFQPYTDNSLSHNPNNFFWIPKSELNKLNDTIDEIIKYKEKYGFVCQPVSYLQNIKEYFKTGTVKEINCQAGFSPFLVNSNGNIGFLCKSHDSLGNAKYDNLSRCWNSSKAKKQRIEIKNCKNICLQNCLPYETFEINYMKDLLKKCENRSQITKLIFKYKKIAKEIKNQVIFLKKYKSEKSIDIHELNKFLNSLNEIIENGNDNNIMYNKR